MPLDSRARIVLDTNSLLDWLVFREPAAMRIGHAVMTGRLLWRASPLMRCEFDHVLGRAALARWQPDKAAAVAIWVAHASIEAEPPAGPLTCTDPHDQVFIDLAIQQRCVWLVTRDRALLERRRRATAWGVTVLTPREWSALRAPGDPPMATA